MTTRRTYLKGVGAGGTAVVAGCVADAPTAREIERKRKQMEQQQTEVATRVSADPTDIPGPITRDSPETVEVTLEPKEVTAEIEPGVEFTFMTYNGQVPGPLIRVRQGDTVDLTFTNPDSNVLPHNVDFHAVAGPGGGAEATMTNPGEETKLRFKATYPGAYIYHCAVPNLDMHISAGMFGIILVEPEGGMPAVDHELYLGQHEVYTDKKVGEAGTHAFDMHAMTREDPTYVLFNGAKFGWTPGVFGSAATVKTGETARVFFVTGGPNLASSFHPIGNVWEELWPEGSLTAQPQTHIQTRRVPPGSTTIATMSFPVPGNFKLVDHSLSRVARKGNMAVVTAEGDQRPDIFDPEPEF